MTTFTAGDGRHEAKELVRRVRQLTGRLGGGIHEPALMGRERQYVNECLDSGFVSSVGPFVDKFELSLAGHVGAARAVALASGTAALHLGLIAVGVKLGDEVLVPALSFAATANAVVHAGGIPHFLDVDPRSWGLSAEYLMDYLQRVAHFVNGKAVNRETGRPIRAIVPVHILGHPVEIETLMAVASSWGLAVVEDAAESLGSWVGDTHTGLFGQVGVFSFNGNKSITTGGGGAVISRNEELAQRIKHLSTTAKVPHQYEFDHDMVGYNYRMPNLNAALGVAQLENLTFLVGQQRKLYALYSTTLEGLEIGSLRTELPGTYSNYWLQAYALKDTYSSQKNEIIKACMEVGIPVRPLWKPLNTLAPFQHFPSDITEVANSLYRRVICLPSSASLAAR